MPGMAVLYGNFCWPLTTENDFCKYLFPPLVTSGAAISSAVGVAVSCKRGGPTSLRLTFTTESQQKLRSLPPLRRSSSARGYADAARAPRQAAPAHCQDHRPTGCGNSLVASCCSECRRVVGASAARTGSDCSGARAASGMCSCR
jgi:hypothetical protein